MYQKNRQLIQLGKGLKAAPMTLRLQSPKEQPSQFNQRRGVGSKDVISSTHKLQIKKSPSRSKVYPHLTTRQVSILNAQNSYTELNNSIVSVSHHQGSPFKKAFNGKTNQMASPHSKERQFVRVNFVNSSENGSRTSSSHLRQFRPSPSKVQKVAISTLVPPAPVNHRQLESKVKILEKRIGELHQQKMQIVADMNEQNRKLYHQNTTLKLNINELEKKIARAQSQREIKNQNQIMKSSKSIEQNLKIQLKEVQSMLETQYQRNAQLNQQIQDLLANQKVYQQNIASWMNQVQNYKNLLIQKQEQLQTYRQSIEKHQQQSQQASGEPQRQRLQSQIAQLKSMLSQTLQKNQQVFSEYEQKIQEYETAYNHNQQIILQLTNELQTYALKQIQTNALKQIQTNALKQPQNLHVQHGQSVNHQQFAQNQIQFDYLQFQNNLNNAITERDNCLKEKNQEILELKQQLTAFQGQFNEKQSKIEGLLSINAELQSQLTRLNSGLNTYTDKITEMQNRYQQVYAKYELQRQRVHRSDGFSQKCKKCEELMKTIFRLNTHLNSKKIS